MGRNGNLEDEDDFPSTTATEPGVGRKGHIYFVRQTVGDDALDGLLTLGGTIPAASRHKPHKMPLPDGSTPDMTGAAVSTCRRLHLDCLVCIGGGGTAKNALRLKEARLNIVTLPKTIDNDVAETVFWRPPWV